MKRLSVMLLLAFVAHGALASQAGADGVADASRAAEAVAGATLAETETLLDRKAAEMIEKTVDEANRRFDDEIDRRLSGLLKVSLLD